MKEPDFIYDPENWDVTYPYKDRDIPLDNLELRPGQLYRFETLLRGPDRFAANVILTRDEHGDPAETELQWFDSEEDVRAALAGEDGNDRR